MSDQSRGDGWWQASDSLWYPPEQHPATPLRPPPPGSTAADQAHQPTATIAFALGVASAMLGVIPILGVFALFPGGIAVILGLVGCLRKPKRAKLAPAAVVLGLIAIGFAVYGIVQLQEVEDDLDDPFGAGMSSITWSPHQATR